MALQSKGPSSYDTFNPSFRAKDSVSVVDATVRFCVAFDQPVAVLVASCHSAYRKPIVSLRREIGIGVNRRFQIRPSFKSKSLLLDLIKLGNCFKCHLPVPTGRVVRMTDKKTNGIRSV